MSEQIVQVQDAATPTKNMRTIQSVVAGNTVQSEVVVLSSNGTNTYDGRQIRALTIADIVSAILTDGSGHNVAIKSTLPLSNDFGLVVRNIPSGTQTVSVAGTPTVSQNLLGATDKPDVTANVSGTLPVAIVDPYTGTKARVDSNGNLIMTPGISPNFSSATKPNPILGAPQYAPVNPSPSPANRNPLIGYGGYRQYK